MLKKFNPLFVLFSLMFFLSCKQEIKVDSGRELIIQNINVLLDSVERFDTSKMPTPEEFENVKIEQIKIGLIDSVLVQNIKDYNSSFIINRNDLVNFKSNYKIEIVKLNNDDVNFLFVSFLNFKVDKYKATIDVKKVIGIAMTKDRYYFTKENGHWVFVRKKNIGIG
ncbi:hypothetical protein J3S90_13560 [Flavobacterium sp. P4023]|uniref:Lipoprotein n=1 Tax=Flavobacterium flabelliforme TaxID=2816119 RepID=A0ABS5CW30_9FLAO|nr:hypothetical protein [Flavobacterium flabelliforme]MBP4142829.1 hypothetical protein [Flavobacterium flabelliforme]